MSSDIMKNVASASPPPEEVGHPALALTTRFSLRPGVSLVESAISIVIVSVVLVAALNTLGSAVRARQIQAERALGPALAQQLMAEILQTNYEEPESGWTTISGSNGVVVGEAPQTPIDPVFGPEPGEADGTRLNFDDVDDYHGWSASPPRAKDGTDISGYGEWTREVAVQYVNPADPTLLVAVDQGLKAITVTATDAKGEETVLVALRSNCGIHEQDRSAETTSVHWIGIELQIGATGTPVATGTIVLNEVPVED